MNDDSICCARVRACPPRRPAVGEVLGRDGGRGLGPLTTLLVIDEDFSHSLLRGLLAELGYSDLEAADGPAGLDRAAQDRPRAIFLDLIMPGLTGFEVLERLKADPATRPIPVIINSSKVLDPGERGRLLVEGVGFAPS